MKKIFAAMILSAFMTASPSYALFSPLTDSKIETSQWKIQYLGETELDGIRVAVLLESMVQEIKIPKVIAEIPQNGTKEAPNSWRLTVVSVDQPSLRATFPLNREVAFVDGTPTKVFYSKQPSASGFHFVIRSLNDGSLHVQYVRDGEQQSNEFQMTPAVQVM